MALPDYRSRPEALTSVPVLIWIDSSEPGLPAGSLHEPSQQAIFSYRLTWNSGDHADPSIRLQVLRSRTYGISLSHDSKPLAVSYTWYPGVTVSSDADEEVLYQIEECEATAVRDVQDFDVIRLSGHNSDTKPKKSSRLYGDQHDRLVLLSFQSNEAQIEVEHGDVLNQFMGGNFDAGDLEVLGAITQRRPTIKILFLLPLDRGSALDFCAREDCAAEVFESFTHECDVGGHPKQLDAYYENGNIEIGPTMPTTNKFANHMLAQYSREKEQALQALMLRTKSQKSRIQTQSTSMKLRWTSAVSNNSPSHTWGLWPVNIRRKTSNLRF